MRRPKPCGNRGHRFPFYFHVEDHVPRRGRGLRCPLRRKTSIGCCGASSTRPSARISSTSSATCGCCPDLAAVRAQMTRHRAVIRPKFEMALNAFATELCGCPAFRGPSRTADILSVLTCPTAAPPEPLLWQRKPALYSRPPAPPSLTDGIRRTPTSASRLHIRRSPSWKRRWT